jgi:hypothetical protein
MLRTLVALFALSCALSVHAHEFWVTPDRFHLPQPGSATLSLAVGQAFVGERVGFSRPLLARFQHIRTGERADLRARVPPDAVAPTWRVDFARPGTHLIAITTEPSEIVLPPEKFNEYLRTEGLEAVLQERARTGRSETAGRERYRRNIKTLVQVGARGDATFAAQTGQRLEILPRSDPTRARSGDPLAFTLLFDARPLPHALVKFWHHQGNQVEVLSATTDRDGHVAFTPTEPGTWMASVVHMIPVTDSPAHDWDSFWGNLTFALRE